MKLATQSLRISQTGAEVLQTYSWGPSLILSVRTGQGIDVRNWAEYLPLYKCSVLVVDSII